MGPVSRQIGSKRKPGDLRRKRLTQLLNHEREKVSSYASSDRHLGPPIPVLCGARSLSPLPSLNSIKSAMFADLNLDVSLEPLAEQAPQLSPLKITRRVGADRSFVLLSSPEYGAATTELLEMSPPNTTKVSKTFQAKTNSSRPLTQQRDRGFFTPIKSSRDSLVREAVVNRDVDHTRDAARKKYARQLEITRRRATVGASSQSFFDRLDSMPVREAIQLFEAQRQALLEFSLLHFRGHVDDDELKLIQDDLLEMTGKKKEKELQTRLKTIQQEELQSEQKKISLQQLKKSHHEQIQRNLVTAKEQRKQQLAARENIVQEQERLDKSCEDRDRQRKHHIETYHEKLAEQIKDNAAARSTFKLAVQGSSPLYRTPWWSDKSEERLKGFQRPMTVQAPTQSPIIYSKQRCRWYD
ncbi:hypothetical protein PPTG_16669 [Phytophthora nicotianae INRA-310]|uniref:Uncharacterized protein n=1 Tax=Phytophthora nicotianae (strain INRA-310) TaxID=761204 RepID=W2PMY7_PHYN3|nr:hypothetical protein PPTG_16669 [Phytophthora nicotianae INRA-310]ETN01991.1 hypothetical protein PPTG_16669 [Phytophthora nicotianae INRA-310]